MNYIEYFYGIKDKIITAFESVEVMQGEQFYAYLFDLFPTEKKLLQLVSQIQKSELYRHIESSRSLYRENRAQFNTYLEREIQKCAADFFLDEQMVRFAAELYVEIRNGPKAGNINKTEDTDAQDLHDNEEDIFWDELLDELLLIDENHAETKKAAESGDLVSQKKPGDIYQDGIEIPRDYQKTVEWHQKCVEQGNAVAQCNLGNAYWNGQGIEKDYQKAVEWYQKAAEQGNAAAQCNLGNAYWNGQGVEKDYQKAVEWYQKAAERNNADAQCNLGIAYWNGWGTEQDYGQALVWFHKAAKQNHAVAQYNLGTAYWSGQGMRQNYIEAVAWYRKSAAQGYPYAQNALGEAYRTGTAVVKDYNEAVHWYRKALDQGYLGAGSGLDKISQLFIRDNKRGNNVIFAKNERYLGSIYWAGKGVTQDYKKAVIWWERAAEQKDSDAQYLLGVAYEEGKGAPKDNDLAMYWYQKAAEQNQAMAQRRLNKI